MADVAVVPSDAEIEQVSKVRMLFQQARTHQRSRYGVWNRNYRLVHNQAWSTARESWMPSPTASEIYPIVAALVGWMTDQRPALGVVPAADPHDRFGDFMQGLARDLEAVLRSVWVAHDGQGEVERTLFDACIYGTGFFKTVWDASLDGGLGNAVVRRTDPFTVFVDPKATSLADANYILEVRNISLQELDRRFPGAAARLADAPATDQLDRRDNLYTSTGEAPMANPGGINGAAPLFGRPGDANQRADFLDDGVTLYEAWVREHDLWTDEEGERHADDLWRVVVVAGNRVLLNEKATDIFGHGRPPYTRYVLHDMGEFWGISLVEHLAPLQISLNRLLAAMQHHAELVGNPVLLEDNRSGIPRTKITNRPGTRLTKNQGAEVGWMPPPEMTTMVPELVRFYIGEMERVSGLSAIVRGMSPSGRNAQGVLDSVQEAAFVRVRLALRNLERALRDAGELQAALIVENYTTPRYLAVLGPDAERNTLALGARHFYLPNEEGAAPMRFSLQVQAGSALPISRQARAQEADVLYGMGAIDRKALLEAHDYPNRQEIITRVMQAEAAGMFNPPGARQRR